MAPVAGMRGWYDASDRANFTFSSGDIVSQWNDLSSNTYHATPQSDAYDHKPTLDANALNGKNALHFLGGNGVVDSNNKNLLFTADTTIRSVFAVFKGASFLLTRSASTYDFHRYNADDTTPSVPLFDGIGGNYTSANLRNGTVRVNGADFAAPINSTAPGGNMPTALNNGFNLISLVTTGNVSADGFNRDRTFHSGEQWHAEMLIYDTAMTMDQVIQIEEYLSDKWKLGLFVYSSYYVSNPSGYSGYSSYSGYSGYSAVSGASGVSGFGTSGASGTAGVGGGTAATVAEVLAATEAAKYVSPLTLNQYQGTVPHADDGSINGDLTAWNAFVKMMKNCMNSGTIFSNPIQTTYSVVYTNATNAYSKGCLDANGDFHMMCSQAPCGQKMNRYGVVSTYSVFITSNYPYLGGCLNSAGDLHFIPQYAPTRGTKINRNGVVSTYALVYTTLWVGNGGAMSPNGDIHIVPSCGAVGQKIAVDGTVSTYALVYSQGHIGGDYYGTYHGGVLAPNGDVHFIPHDAFVGQKVAPDGTVSTYSLVYTARQAYAGGVLNLEGDIHMVPKQAEVGQKIDINGVVSTYSLAYTAAANAYRGGCLGLDGYVYFARAAATVNQRISPTGVPSTFPVVGASLFGEGMILMENGDLVVPNHIGESGQKIQTFSGLPLSRGALCSSFLNRY